MDSQHRLVGFSNIRHYEDGSTTTKRWRYQYDAFGRRIRKVDESNGESTLFFWQGDKLVTECNEAQADFTPTVVSNEYSKAESYRCTSYIYESGESFIPLAQICGKGRGGQVYYYINDQLGTPQELVAANGDIVWSGIYRTYGNLAVAAGQVEQHLRFQGQYYDEESGLHYNRYRYYDPLAGRYISQDPIGLAGGLNSYAYVPNPLLYIDPLGLQGCRAPPRLDDGNLKEGWEHIRSRHIDGNHPSGAGDLFPPSTTRANIDNYAKIIVEKGTRQSDPAKRMQTFESRLNINGLRANYRLIVDSEDGNRIITMFPVLGGGH